ncbi:MAG: hypothetical protein RL302_1364 [Pseudomonadota bacterium]|jgi:Protein of unknown function (DUF2783)
MPLNRHPNIASPDSFYEALIHAQRDVDDEQADMLMAKLVLILANHIGDRAVLSEAIALARSNTLGQTTAALA